VLLLKNIESYLATEEGKHNDQKDIMSDIRYICKSCSLITESLQKGCDVMQMPNGDIIITEVKTFTFQYTWDDKKGKLIRVQSGGRLKKAKQKRLESHDYDEFEDVA
jgi:hypothetical protein